MVKLWVARYSDYRTGTKIEVYDMQDLKDMYEALTSDSESDSAELQHSDKEINQEMTEDDYIGEIIGENLYDIVEIDAKREIYSIYVCMGNGYEDGEIIYIANMDDKELAKKALKHIFSDIHECKPFEVTGVTSGYKEKGYYPDPLPSMKIDGKPLLEESIIKRIREDDHYYCVAVILKNDWVIDHIQIRPLF